jgi:hypothetical protein
MLDRTWARALAVCAVLSTSLLAGDYGHVLDVVSQAWPERAKGVVLCSLEANQFTLLDLVDTAKERGLNLTIVNMKELKALDKTIATTLSRRPDFVLIIDDDPILGSKGTALPRLLARAASLGIPTVGMSVEPLKVGGAIAAGAAVTDKVYFNEVVLKTLKLPIPDGAVAYK